MRVSRRFTTMLVAAWLLACLPSWAQETPASASPVEQFKKLYADWDALLQKIPELQKKYAKATPQEQAAIETEFNNLVKKLDAATPKLRKAAEAAFDAAGDKEPDAQATEFLVGVVAERVSRDQYEDASKLAAKLLARGVKEANLLQLAGVAAFSIHQFDEAEKLLKQASNEGTLSRMGASYLSSIPKYKEYWKTEKELREKEAKADDLPRVVFKTSKGDITIELFENEAPLAVNNFVALVEKKYYDGLKFHRVLPNFMAQGGCPKGDGSGGPGYNIACECYQDNHRKHFRGSLSMAHAGKDTGGSQFFLTFLPTSHLNGRHTVFGRIISGMDVLGELQRTGRAGGGAPPDSIKQATVIRKRDHKYEPTKVE